MKLGMLPNKEIEQVYNHQIDIKNKRSSTTSMTFQQKKSIQLNKKNEF